MPRSTSSGSGSSGRCIQTGGLSLASARSVVDALDSPPDSVVRPAGQGARGVAGTGSEHAERPEVTELITELGWHVNPVRRRPQHPQRGTGGHRGGGGAGAAPRPAALRQGSRGDRRGGRRLRDVGARHEPHAADRRRRHGDDRPGPVRPASPGPGARDGAAAGPSSSTWAGSARRRRPLAWARGAVDVRSPDGIRTRATALRGRRARPLHNGALAGVQRPEPHRTAKRTLPCARGFLRIGSVSAEGRPARERELGYQDSNLERRNQNTVVLPITPYPKGVSRPIRPEAITAANQGRYYRSTRQSSKIGQSSTIRQRGPPGPRAAGRSRASVEVLPRISIDSNSGGEIRAPETAVRSGPNANLGLMPSPSTIAARSAASMAAAVQRGARCRALRAGVVEVAEHLQGSVEHRRASSLSCGPGVVGDLESWSSATIEGGDERRRLGQRGHAGLDQLGDRP